MITVTTEPVKEVKKKPKYPYLGIAADGDIVLFVSLDTGTLIKSLEYSVGRHSIAWMERNFTPYEGTITLRNE